MVNRLIDSIFKTGSVTYYLSSSFFPKQIRQEVFILYAFVRTADNFVDQVPADSQGFKKFRAEFNQALTQSSSNPIISEFVSLAHRRQFSITWINSFLDAMDSDQRPQICQTLDDTISYMYGSAEVIGLMMSQILQLPSQSHFSAQMLGRAMQYANFIRDIDEDNHLHRQYLPQSELDKFQLQNLTKSHILANLQSFKSFIQAQIDYYYIWQQQAEKGYQYIPKSSLIPIKTASQMYTWTLKEISKDPTIIFHKKVKPSKSKVIFAALNNYL